MFEHFLAGELIFILFGKIFGLDITPEFLLLGAFCGWFPDFLSFFLSKRVKYDKWFHSHRDNFSHTIFLPLIVFVILCFSVNLEWALMVSLAILSHPILDLYGIGWGVQLFLPFSDDIYKIFYRHKIIYIFDNEEARNADVEKYQTNNWFKRAYFSFKPCRGTPWWWLLLEWPSLVLAIYLVLPINWR